MLVGNFEFPHKRWEEDIENIRRKFNPSYLALGMMNILSVVPFDERIKSFRELQGIDELIMLSREIDEELLNELDIDFIVVTEELSIRERTTNDIELRVNYESLVEYYKENYPESFSHPILENLSTKEVLEELKTLVKKFLGNLQIKSMGMGLAFEFFINNVRKIYEDHTIPWKHTFEEKLTELLYSSSHSVKRIYYFLKQELLKLATRIKSRISNPR